jgi:hypothetical protein
VSQRASLPSLYPVHRVRLPGRLLSLSLALYICIYIYGVQKAVMRRVEHRSYRTMMEEKDARESLAPAASGGCGQSSSPVGQWEDGMSHPFLDNMADKLLDCLPRLPRWLPFPPNIPGNIQMTASRLRVRRTPRPCPLRISKVL